MIAAAEQKPRLHEIAFCDFLAKRSNGAEADDALTQALTACLLAGIEVVSVLPEWVELRVPCDNPFRHAFVREEKGSAQGRLRHSASQPVRRRLGLQRAA
jgi:hypothetical protein